MSEIRNEENLIEGKVLDKCLTADQNRQNALSEGVKLCVSYILQDSQ